MAETNFEEMLKPVEDQLQELYDEHKSSGMVIAIIKGSKIVYTRCYGYRDIGNKLEMTTDTLFDIGSISKSFTATAVALMVEEDHFDWDTPVSEYYPGLQFHDKMASNRITVRDMLSHRTGLPRHDLSWFLDDNVSYDKLLDRIPHLKLSKDLRYEFQYNNLMYNMAALLVQHFSGKPFPEFVKDRLFDPLEMFVSTLDHEAAASSDKMALPYFIENGSPVVKPYYVEKGVFGPGGIKTTAEELANWLLFNINEGTFNDEELLSANNIEQIHKPTTIVGGNGISGGIIPEEEFSQIPCYALGWGVEVYQGKKLLSHGGGIDGFTSLASFMPDEELGVICLANENGSVIPIVATLAIYDVLLDLERKDWIKRGINLMDQIRQSSVDAKQGLLDQAVQGTEPSKPLSEFCGTYARDGYPPFEVKLREDQLYLITPRLEFPMEHLHYDSFLVVVDRFKQYLTLIFNMDEKGEINRFEVGMEPTLPIMEFKRQPDTLDSQLMEKLAGKFSFLDREIEVIHKDDKLYLEFPGGSPQELIYERNMRFKIKGQEHADFKFVKDEHDNYNEIKMQYVGTLREAKRVE